MPDAASFVSPVPSVAEDSGSVLPEICGRPMFKLTEVGSVTKLNSIQKMSAQFLVLEREREAILHQRTWLQSFVH